MRKSVQHFLGFENEESRQLATEEDFLGPQEGREIPSQEEDLCLEGTLAEENFLFAQTSALFREAPGSLEVSFAYRQEAEQRLQPIYFAEDSHAIGKDESKALDQIAQLLETNPGFSLLIEGHCDSRASAAYNRALAKKCADEVRLRLAEKGIDADRLYTTSYGKKHAVSTGFLSGSFRQNSRVTFKLFREE